MRPATPAATQRGCASWRSTDQRGPFPVRATDAASRDGGGPQRAPQHSARAQQILRPGREGQQDRRQPRAFEPASAQDRPDSPRPFWTAEGACPRGMENGSSATPVDAACAARAAYSMLARRRSAARTAQSANRRRQDPHPSHARQRNNRFRALPRARQAGQREVGIGTHHARSAISNDRRGFVDVLSSADRSPNTPSSRARRSDPNKGNSPVNWRRSVAPTSSATSASVSDIT